MKLKVLDLFSGIGGFSLGLERAGMETVAFCENDFHCQKVLMKHWPSVKLFSNVKNLSYQDGELIYSIPGKIDEEIKLKTEINVIAGGFPCQDISIGGKGIGLKGERSGLWSQYKRLIDEIRPEYAIIENVERLRKKGLGIVLRDLCEIGYDAEWHCITADAIGLPHQRDRLWIIAYDSSIGSDERAVRRGRIQADTKWPSEEIHKEGERRELKPGEICTFLSRGAIDSIRASNSSEFSSVLKVRRVVDGLSKELDKVRMREIHQLGNSVVPQIPEMIGKEIIKHYWGNNE